MRFIEILTIILFTFIKQTIQNKFLQKNREIFNRYTKKSGITNILNNLANENNNTLASCVKDVQAIFELSANGIDWAYKSIFNFLKILSILS